MTTLEHINFQNITYEKAHDFARVMVDAFRDEAVGLALLPAKDRLDDASLPPISEYENLLYKARRFERNATSLAKMIHIGARSDWRNHIFLLRDSDGRPVAGAQWQLPKYQPKPASTPSLWFRFKTFLLKAWYYVSSIGKTHNWAASPVGQMFLSVADEYQCTDTKDRVSQLEKLPVSELRATTYPKGTSYYLDLFFVRSGQQGKKYGNKLMEGSLDFIKKQAVPPPNLAPGAPPKATLQAVPKARGFYKKFGYEVGATAERKGNQNESLIFTFYYMNLD